MFFRDYPSFKRFNRKNEYLHRQDLKSQMFALQAQINPHFIHNILTVISALGQEAGAREL